MEGINNTAFVPLTLVLSHISLERRKISSIEASCHVLRLKTTRDCSVSHYPVSTICVACSVVGRMLTARLQSAPLSGTTLFLIPNASYHQPTSVS